MAIVPKGTRLCSLQERFKSGAKLTNQMIQESYGVNRRTANRDIADLVESGLVLEHETLGSGKRVWFVPQPAREIAVRYSLMDVMSLFMGRRLFDFMENTIMEESFKRVYQRIEEQLTYANDLDNARKLAQKVYLVHEGPKKLPKRAVEILDDCLSGLLREKKLRIGYRNSAGVLKRYLIHPYSLVAYKRGLYLVAKVEERNGERVFNLERITSAAWLKEQPFRYPRDYDPERFFEKSLFIVIGQPERVVLRFTATTEPFIKIRKFHKTQRLTKKRDGRLEMTLDVPVSFELVNWVLSFGPHVEAIGPPSLRDQVVDALSRTLAQYPA